MYALMWENDAVALCPEADGDRTLVDVNQRRFVRVQANCYADSGQYNAADCQPLHRQGTIKSKAPDKMYCQQYGSGYTYESSQIDQ